MKKLILPIVIPLTILIEIIFSKWWYVTIIDGDDQLCQGFPFINEAPSLASSMTFQVFIFPTILNYSIVFAVSFLLVYLFNRLVKAIKPTKMLKIVSFVFVVIFIAFEIWICNAMETRFYWKNNFTNETLGGGFWWQQVKSREYYHCNSIKEKLIGKWKLKSSDMYFFMKPEWHETRKIRQTTLQFFEGDSMIQTTLDSERLQYNYRSPYWVTSCMYKITVDSIGWYEKKYDLPENKKYKSNFYFTKIDFKEGNKIFTLTMLDNGESDSILNVSTFEKTDE
jgi:hypothetical protein